MLCDRCKQNQATVHTVTIVNGEKQEHYLCGECAKGVQFKLPSLMDVLSGTWGMPQSAEKTCACGAGLGRFQETGLLGCPECYTAFENRLIPVIKRAQGGRLRHVGRRPEGAAAPAAEPKAEQPVDEVGRLRAELNEAVKAEQYERAAELRDRIRAMEQEG